MEDNTMMILEEIRKFTVRTPEERKVANVSFYGSTEEKRRKRLDEALCLANNEERLTLTLELLDVWMHKSDEAVRKIFGDCCVELRSSDVKFTLTGNGRQLRAWHGEYGYIDFKHTDSCGEGLLFTVSGNEIVISQYLSVLKLMGFISVRKGKGFVFYKETE